jgi:2-keto-4-pentenoate hydratase/2-oxohepta-3-ene-1,7-dioic acid hydratase in catechol pathway
MKCMTIIPASWRITAKPVLRRPRLVASVAFFGLIGCTSVSEEPDGFLVGPAFDLPKLVRFVSRAPATDGKQCFGEVVREADGVPQQVRVLPATMGFDPCANPPTLDAAAAQLGAALNVLDELASVAPTEIEEIAAADLPERILPPVRVDEDWLDQDKVFIVAAGLNYEDHKAETGGGKFVLFPKPVEPTGPYDPVPLTPLEAGGSVCLLDYEVEIAFVALQELKLPDDADKPWPELASKLAFFAVNDVTDRTSQILDPDTGFTQAKTRKGFLPSGPWLVAGRNLVQGTDDDPADALTLELWTRDAAGTDTSRKSSQRAFSADLIVGVPEILTRLAPLDPDGKDCAEGNNRVGEQYCTMPDADRERRMVRDLTLPAGSIVLTGTPGGTALTTPDLPGKLRLFLRAAAHGKPSFEGGREVYLADQVKDRDALGYLESGDEVDQAIKHLGRQTWSVVVPDGGTDCTPAT